jgi:signal transduction histidine kinase
MSMEAVVTRRCGLLSQLASWGTYFLLFLAGMLVLSPFSESQQVKPIRRVLLLNDLGVVSTPGFAEVDQAIFAGLQKSPYQIELYLESLEVTLFPDENSQRQFREAFIRKYSERKPDLIIAAGSVSLQFVAEFHEGLFQETPIVFCAVLGEIPGQLKTDSHVTGVLGRLHPAETLNAALQLLPGTRQVVVVGGTGKFDRLWQAIAKQSFQDFESKLQFTYLTDLTMPALLDRLQHLPRDAVVYHTAVTRDVAGTRFVDSAQAVPMVAGASNVPVFVMDDVDLRAGVVGGDLVNWADDARVAATMAVRILNGEKPQAIPVVPSNDSYIFDARALRRWGIRESALPPSSIVLFREPTLWERTKWIWLGSLAVIVCLAGLAAYLHYSRLQIKIARDAELHLSGLVIHAQEKERSRLAAELHDDFGQRLALLIVGLEDAAESLPPSAVEIKHKLDELIASAGDLGDDLHTLSHHLHSATLDKLGLVTGLRALCEEFTARHGIVVSFSSDGVPRDIQSDVALCLFRIAQEGLQNIKKHSGASRAEVNLRQVEDSLRLRVRDEGKGFDPENMKRQAGLGLRSMEGRAHLLGGRLRILSDQGKGTRIDAIVPLEPHRDRGRDRES